jgi:hypothetical protein
MARSRIGVEPHDAALRRQPFDAIVPSAHRIGERSFRIVEAARSLIADSGQNAVERLDIVSVGNNVPPLRNCGRADRHERQKNRRDSAPEHELFYRFCNEWRMNGPARLSS